MWEHVLLHFNNIWSQDQVHICIYFFVHSIFNHFLKVYIDLEHLQLLEKLFQVFGPLYLIDIWENFFLQ